MRIKTSWRLAAPIAALMLATGLTAASAQTQGRSEHGNRGGGLELTFTKWFDPGFPHMVGVVGGDVDGQFGGAVLQATSDGRLKAIYIVVAPDPSRSLTIRLNGASDQSGTAVLEGRVVDGRLTGARARVEFKLIDCEQSVGPCFQGTISIKQREGDEGDEGDDG
jgi:hypothetical protein